MMLTKTGPWTAIIRNIQLAAGRTEAGTGGGHRLDEASGPPLLHVMLAFGRVAKIWYAEARRGEERHLPRARPARRVTSEGREIIRGGGGGRSQIGRKGRSERVGGEERGVGNGSGVGEAGVGSARGGGA